MIVARLNVIFQEYIDEPYELEVVDISLTPEIAIEKQIIATPTFIKNFPPPPLRIIGEMNDRQFLLEWLAIDASAGDGTTDLGDAP